MNTNSKPFFWMSVIVIALGSAGCFGFAGLQLNDGTAPSRHEVDGPSNSKSEGAKHRSPVYFQRTTPAPVMIITASR